MYKNFCKHNMRKLLAWFLLAVCVAVVLVGLGVAMWLLGSRWYLPLLPIGMLAMMFAEACFVQWIDEKYPQKGLHYARLCTYAALGGFGISLEFFWWGCHWFSAAVVHATLAGVVGAVLLALWLRRMAKMAEMAEEDK